MIVLDTSVLTYAVGDPHRFEAPSRELMNAIGAGRIAATTTVEVIQEFAHVRARRRSRGRAISDAESFALALAPLISTDSVDVHMGLEIFGATRLGAFDAVLAAAAMRRGADALVTADAAFAEVAGLRVLALDGPELAELIRA